MVLCISSMDCCAVLSPLSSLICNYLTEEKTSCFTLSVSVLCHLRMVAWFGLQYMIMIFSGHTHLHVLLGLN